MDASGGAVDRRRMKPGDPIRQTEEIGEIQLSDQALVFAEGRDDFRRVLGAELPPENRPADNLRRQCRHLGQRIDRHLLRQVRPAFDGFAGSLDHQWREEWQMRLLRAAPRLFQCTGAEA